MSVSYENRNSVCGAVGAAEFVMSVACAVVMMTGAAFAAPVFSVLLIGIILPILPGLLLLARILPLPRRLARR